MNKDAHHSIKVATQVRHLSGQSNPASGRYAFSYTITISNLGQQTVQLLSRHWIITDANNRVEEVRGEGVVGEQPILRSGEHFEYTSGTVLNTPVGVMSGNYTLQTESGFRFEVPIPQFVLSIPRVLH